MALIKKIKQLLQLDLAKTGYVSETDQFLKQVDQKISLSPSQEKEQAKFAKIAQLRDHLSKEAQRSRIWVNF